jgi:hypothetical protein
MEEQPGFHLDSTDPNSILIAEFEYIAQTAFQANEDRARVSNYYLVTVAAAVAAIVGAKIENTTPLGIYAGFSALFIVLSAYGAFTLLQLARLRSAWVESARAMNQIKDYYIHKYPEAKLAEAFAWTSNSIPAPNKGKSVAFLLALSVMVIDAFTAGAAMVYGGLALDLPQKNPFLVIAGIGLVAAFAFMQYRGYAAWLKPGAHGSH